MLYKDGPRFYHASYVVLVMCTPRDADGTDRLPALDTHSLQGHYRIAEASKKVRVHTTTTTTTTTPNSSNFD